MFYNELTLVATAMLIFDKTGIHSHYCHPTHMKIDEN